MDEKIQGEADISGLELPEDEDGGGGRSGGDGKGAANDARSPQLSAKHDGRSGVSEALSGVVSEVPIARAYGAELIGSQPVTALPSVRQLRRAGPREYLTGSSPWHAVQHLVLLMEGRHPEQQRYDRAVCGVGAPRPAGWDYHSPPSATTICRDCEAHAGLLIVLPGG